MAWSTTWSLISNPELLEPSGTRAVTSSSVTGAFPHDIRAVRLVPGDHGRGLCVVHLQSIADGVRFVVATPYQRAAALVTAVPGSQSRVWRLAPIADGAAADPTDQFVVADLEHDHDRVSVRPSFARAVAWSPSACGTVRTTPSRMAPGRRGGASNASFMMPRMTRSGTSAPRSIYALASRPNARPLPHGRPQDIAGADLGNPQCGREHARPGCPCPHRAGRAARRSYSPVSGALRATVATASVAADRRLPCGPSAHGALSS